MATTQFDLLARIGVLVDAFRIPKLLIRASQAIRVQLAFARLVLRYLAILGAKSPIVIWEGGRPDIRDVGARSIRAQTVRYGGLEIPDLGRPVAVDREERSATRSRAAPCEHAFRVWCLVIGPTPFACYEPDRLCSQGHLMAIRRRALNRDIDLPERMIDSAWANGLLPW